MRLFRRPMLLPSLSLSLSLQNTTRQAMRDESGYAVISAFFFFGALRYARNWSVTMAQAQSRK